MTDLLTECKAAEDRSAEGFRDDSSKSIARAFISKDKDRGEYSLRSSQPSSSKVNNILYGARHSFVNIFTGGEQNEFNGVRLRKVRLYNNTTQLIQESPSNGVRDQYSHYVQLFKNNMLPSVSECSDLDRAVILDLMGGTDHAMEMLYESVDEIFSDGDFQKVDTFLRNIPVADLSTDMILALLTTSMWAASKLPSRNLFRKKCSAVLLERNEPLDELLEGI